MSEQLPNESSQITPITAPSESPVSSCQCKEGCGIHHKPKTYSGRPLIEMVLAGLIGGGLMFGLVQHFGSVSDTTGSQDTDKKVVGDILPGVEDDQLIRLVEERSAGVVSIIISKEVAPAPTFGSLPFFFPFNTTPQEPQTEGDATGESKKQQVGSGSGFIVSSDGLVVTNKHVVSDEGATYTVVLSGGKEFEAKVLARDPYNDIAILKIEGSDFPVLPLGNSDAI